MQNFEHQTVHPEIEDDPVEDILNNPDLNLEQKLMALQTRKLELHDRLDKVPKNDRTSYNHLKFELDSLNQVMEDLDRH